MHSGPSPINIQASTTTVTYGGEFSNFNETLANLSCLPDRLNAVSSPPANLYCKFALVSIRNKSGVALIDSGNTWRSVISEDFANTLGFSSCNLKPIPITTVGTAKHNSTLHVLGELPTNIFLLFQNCPVKFRCKPAVIRDLAMSINISGPFLKRHNLNQMHSLNCLQYFDYQIPLLSSAPDCRSFEHTVSDVYVLTPTTIPPCSIAMLSAEIVGIRDGHMPSAAGCVTGDLTFMQLTDSHPWINAIVTPETNGTVKVGVLNTLGVPIHIKKNCKYGTFALTCPPQDQDRYPWRIATMEKTSMKENLSPSHLASPETEQSKLPSHLQGPTTMKNIMARKAFIKQEFKLDDSDSLQNDEQKNQLVELILKYFDVFSFDGGFGTTDLISHKIYTDEGPPINQRYRPINPSLEPQLKTQLDEWLQHDVIEESNSPWNFGLVAVPKKNGRVRWCVDFRDLNKRSKRDTYPIGSIEDNLVRLSYSTTFSGLDASGAFHVVPLEEDSREKTAFATPFGSFQFKRLPFGLANGPATYARLVKLVLQGIPTSVALPYLDDVIVHSPNVLQHFQDLGQVFASYRKAGLKLQPAKCQLFRKQIDYLGHTVSKDGIAPLAKYIEVIKTWPIPTTRHETRAFLGKVGYYRRFIKDFAAKAKPLTDKLAQDGTSDKEKFELTPELKSSFNTLVKALLTQPILAYPRFNSDKPFIVDTDWSMENAAIGGVLSQEQDHLERVIAYGAHKLLPSQTRYGSTKGELYALIYFIQYWKYFLQFRPFLVRTDHMALKHIQNMNAPNGMIQRWLHILSNFTFTIQHRPGPRHGNADGLSRAPHLKCEHKPSTVEDIDISAMTLTHFDDDSKGTLTKHDVPPSVLNPRLVSEITNTFENNQWKVWTPHYLKIHQKNDPDIAALIPYLKMGLKPSDTLVKSFSPVGQIYARLMDSLFLDKMNLVRYRYVTHIAGRKTVREVLLLPYLLITPAIMRAHKQMAHMGNTATYNKLRLHAFFPHMLTKITQVLMNCGPCQLKTTRLPDQKHTLRSHQPGYPFQVLSLDFVGPFPLSHPKKYKYLLTIKDTFTRWVEAFPIHHADAQTVVHILQTEIFPRYGFCERLHSDRGTQFTSDLLQTTGKLLKIKISHTPAYNAKSNPVERSHRDLKAALNALTRDKPSAWADYIPFILYAFRSAISKSTGFSPFQLMFGRNPIEDLDTLLPSPTYEQQLRTTPEYFTEISDKLIQAHHLARENMKMTIERQRLNYSRTAKTYNKGEMVWLFTPVLFERKTPKFVTGWSGPWKIIEKINDLMYTIQFTSENRNEDSLPVRTETVSIDRLRRYYPDLSDVQIPPLNQNHQMAGDEFLTQLPGDCSPVSDNSTVHPSLPFRPRPKSTQASTPLQLMEESDEMIETDEIVAPHTTDSVNEQGFSDPINQWIDNEPEETPSRKMKPVKISYSKETTLMSDHERLKQQKVKQNTADKLTSAAKLTPAYDAALRRYRPGQSCQQQRKDRYLKRQNSINPCINDDVGATAENISVDNEKVPTETDDTETTE